MDNWYRSGKVPRPVVAPAFQYQETQGRAVEKKVEYVQGTGEGAALEHTQFFNKMWFREKRSQAEQYTGDNDERKWNSVKPFHGELSVKKDF